MIVKRWMLMVCLLGACELRPAPKTDPATQMEPMGSAAPAQPAATPPAVDAGVAVVTVDAPPQPQPVAVVDAGAPPAVDAGIEPSAECTGIAERIAGILIEATTDPAQRSALEQDKLKLVRRMAEACTRDTWPQTAKACFQAATTPDQIQECGKGLQPPRQ